MEIRLDRRLAIVAWLSLLVAFVSGVAWLFATASSMSGTPLTAVMQQGVLGVVLTKTRFGEDWIWRGVLVIVLAICLAVQSRLWKPARWISLLVSSALVASIVWAGHGAAQDDLPFDFLHFPADLLHLLATSAWLGGLVPLWFLLTAIGPDAADAERAVARIASARFSALAVTCVAALLVTGIVNTWFLSGSIPALVGTQYGQLLLLKIALFAIMIVIGNINRSRLVPAGTPAQAERLARNALTESCIGVLVLGIVGIIGTLPPGLHTEPRWPFPYRLDLDEISVGAQNALDIAATLFVVCLAAAAFTADRRRYRGTALSIVGLVVFGSVAAIAMRPGIVPAYPTTYFASTQPYAAPSVAHGEPLYAANCTQCHGVDGRGDGPIAKSLSIPPADLTEEHIFAHSVGDLYWWISNGRANGVMPGFEQTLTPQQRWDVINFVLARAAGVQTAETGNQISSSAAPPLPDFAFERGGEQNTLSQTLKSGPALLVLFARPAPDARLKRLADLRPRLRAATLDVIAVDLTTSRNKAPLTVDVSDDVRATLELFRSPQDGGETDLMLDRNGSVRARWTANGKDHLADDDTLLSDAVKVAKIPAAAANHAGHGG